MSSQTDLDQGGTFRQYQRVFMGPSIGWLTVPQQAVLPITTVGSINIARGTNLITINVNGTVNIALPSSKASVVGPGAIPGQWWLELVTIADVGGFAGSNLYRITPNGSETISGLTFIDLVSPYGAYVLKPLLETGGWTLLQ